MFSPEDAYLNRSNHKVGKCFECEANFGATDDKQSDKAPPFFNVIKKPSLMGTSGNPKDTSVKTLFYFNYSINCWA
jgi:hypothetical protein